MPAKVAFRCLACTVLDAAAAGEALKNSHTFCKVYAPVVAFATKQQDHTLLICLQ